MAWPHPDKFRRTNAVITGTPASPASCRDKGRMRGRVGALCLSSLHHDSSRFRVAQWTYPREDKHKAPTSAPPRPLSLQKTPPFSPLPDSVVKHHQDGGTYYRIRLEKFIRDKGLVLVWLVIEKKTDSLKNSRQPACREPIAAWILPL